MNDLTVRHPMNGVRYTKPVHAVNDIRHLTLEEQEKFMEVAKRSHNYYPYALLLETGLRTGELVGLTWDGIDWKKRTLTVNKTLEYMDRRTGEKSTLVMSDLVFINWRTGEPAMIPIFTNCATRQKSSGFVCTPYAIHTQPGRSKAVCNPKCCRSCSDTPASKQRWIVTST